MKKEIYQIHITLEGSKPKIWRRLLVPSSLPLADLHKIIQTSMGWENAHTHIFIHNDTVYATKEAIDKLTTVPSSFIDYKKTRLQDLLKAENDRLIYEYDPKDQWRHIILLEKILPMDPAFKHPVCIAGKMRCPPEDSGGIEEYINLLEMLKNKRSSGYKNAAYWLGTEYDPEYFDRDEVNELLRSKNYGCF